MDRQATIERFAQCRALAEQGPNVAALTPEERAQHAQACANADADAWRRIHAQPQLELRAAA